MLLSLLLLCSIAGVSQSAETADTGGRVVLVLPFDNRSGQAALAWVGDSFPDTLNQRLTSAGFLTITREDRQYALDHLGLPIDFRPSRATTIRIAQNLDADFVIVGSFNVINGRIAVQAQVLEVKNLRLSAPLQDSSELNRLFDVENAIAWKVARQIDPHFNVAQQTFLAASGGVQLSAFENYIRGTDAPTSQERVKRLQAAIAANPNYPAALLALGKAQYAEREYDQAAATFAKIPPTDRRALEAGFYIGLSRFNTAKYAEAESAFSFVASRLPLPEVVNNQAVASSRQGHNAVPLFQRASMADPNDPDYHYNLAVALFRQGDFAGAKREVDLTLKLRPADTEAAQLKTSISAGRRPPTPTASATDTEASSDFDPLERIRRTYSEASFRQAAFQLDQMRAMRLATLPPAEQAAEYTRQGHEYLSQGLVPEAEQEFQTAIAADSASAEAHAGLAQVRERSGNAADARAEAQSSIMLRPNVPAYLVLARLDLQTNDPSASASNVSKALKLDPMNSAAQGMRQALQARGQSLP
ncbi:tetratricopeptide repeat protein [Tunturibacter empetritectus]|uniref:Tetratricopeptide (TPR) repeat protein n=2 Tax=Tunturiibacter empetritectus TaxID=3069691 RepID=A0A7W8IM68_9BACT|nr:tetratricopeptide repeat protein [Edaphobacter lichenicola]MBB5319035.1 tetratricopeptide (TPR) repeat protein [Edaphobacter lichenicola]